MARPGTHTAADIANLAVRQSGKCAVCRTKMRKHHVDHIVPLSKGGTNDKHNLQLLCPPCNLRKTNKDPVEFMQQQGFLI